MNNYSKIIKPDIGVITNISYEFTKVEKGDIKKIVSATGTIVPTSEIILSSAHPHTRQLRYMHILQSSI